MFAYCLKFTYFHANPSSSCRPVHLVIIFSTSDVAVRCAIFCTSIRTHSLSYRKWFILIINCMNLCNGAVVEMLNSDCATKRMISLWFNGIHVAKVLQIKPHLSDGHVQVIEWGSLVTLCSHKSGRRAVELYHVPDLWYPPFYTSTMASSALQH